MINLLSGSIFDSKCDLVIIPCDDWGGVTNWVRQELNAHSFPSIKRVPAGEVWYTELMSDFPNASFVGYAASVSTKGGVVESSKVIIEAICNNIRRYCKFNSVNKVNMPLLGTGAGRLSPLDSFEVIKSVFEKDQDISINIYVVNKTSYDALKKYYVSSPARVIKNPRVFLSYTGTDEKNGRWVKKLADRLRASGVDARIDIYHLKPGQDLPQWMTNELIMADKVLLICDKNYAEKADVRKGGVGWETMIIQGDMLTHQEQNKYIAVARDNDIDKSLPIYVKSKYSLVLPNEEIDDADFEKLLMYLFDCNTEPPIGKIPDYIINNLANSK